MNDAALILSIYTRAECHLCDDMLDGLKRWQKHYNFTINIVDIDTDSSLTERFAARIPIIAAGDTEICQYHLDETALSRFFSNIN